MRRHEDDYLLEKWDIIEIEWNDTINNIRYYTYIVNGEIFISSNTEVCEIRICEAIEGCYTHTFINNKTWVAIKSITGEKTDE